MFVSMLVPKLANIVLLAFNKLNAAVTTLVALLSFSCSVLFSSRTVAGRALFFES